MGRNIRHKGSGGHKTRLKTRLDGVSVAHAAAGNAAPVKSTELVKEIASYSRDFLAAPLINGVVPNPDEVMITLAPGRLNQYQKLGTDPYLLHRMMRRSDLKYKSLIQTRKNGVLSKEWRVLPNPTDPDQKRASEVAEFVKAALGQIRNMQEALGCLLDAIPQGFSVSEIIWEQKTVRFGSGQARESWVPVDLRQRRQGRFGFAEDWSLRYQETAGKFVEVPPAKFVVHTHGRELDSAYGTAECSEVFWAWYMKHNFVKWWAIFSEKFGMPTALGEYPANWDDAKKKKLMQAMKAIQTEYAVAMPQGAKISFLEAVRAGSINTYQGFCEWADKCMSEALTGQSLATGQGQSGTGSFAQSQTHEAVKQEYVEADAKDLMATINPQLISIMVGINYGADVPVPSWVIDYESKDLKGDLELDGKLVDLGLPLSTEYFYSRYGRPAPADGETIISGRKTGKPSTPPPGGVPEEEPVEDPEGDEKPANPKRKAKPKAKHAGSGEVLCFSVDDSAEIEIKRRRRETDRLLSKLSKEGKTIFGQLGDMILAEVEAATDMRDVRQRVHALGAKREIVLQLTDSLQKAKVNGYLFAAAQAYRYYNEVMAAETAEAEQEASQHSAAKTLASYEPLSPAEALKWFKELVPLTKEDLDKLPREASGHAFTIADFETRETLQEIQDLISEFLNSGRTKADFVKEFQAKRKELGLDPVENYQAEQIYRTETHRAYGAGRTRSLLDPEVKDAFPLWQYIAVMDDRTRDEHFALNGFVAAPDDTFWLTKNPPWDYNCRCDVIPLTRRQIEKLGIVEKPTVTMPDGSEVDPRTWPTSPGFRGLGFSKWQTPVAA